MNSKTLADIIEYSLCHFPDSKGRRLKSDRELARLFRVGESKIRYSLEHLVKRGILKRKQGSGTFVQQSVSRPPMVVDIPFAEMSPEMLFSEHLPSHPPHQPQQRVHLGLWGDLKETSQTNYKVLSEIVAYASEYRHHFTIHSVLGPGLERISHDELRRQIAGYSCDVYLVVHTFAELFMSALADRDQRVLFFSTSSKTNKELLDNAPVVYFDTVRATEMAVALLAEAGYQRIAYMSCRPGFTELCHRGYERSLDALGLDYRATADPILSKGIGPTQQAFHTLITEQRPDAIYVSDDSQLPLITQVLTQQGLVPGRDIGVVTLSNRGVALPNDFAWSRLEFNTQELARILINKAIAWTNGDATAKTSIGLLPEWIPGDTVAIGSPLDTSSVPRD